MTMLYIAHIQAKTLSRTAVVEEAFVVSAEARSKVWVPIDVLGRRELPLRIVPCQGGHAILADGVVHEHGYVTPLGLRIYVEALIPELYPVDTHGLMRGDSLPMRHLFREIRLAASTDASTLISGETGTGKELIARSLHALSARRARPFNVIDCAALTESLLESELFGHVKGAFSSAHANRIGTFEEADGGTIFIDEIGEVPMSMQPRLLRVLESGTIRRVGENTHRKVDVRIVAATHRDLKKMVSAGQFREDLFYRLAVLELHVPPLRERHGDLVDLMRVFVPENLVETLDLIQWEAIETHAWPGNIRELRNFGQRAAIRGWERLFAESHDAPSSTRIKQAPVSGQEPSALMPRESTGQMPAMTALAEDVSPGSTSTRPSHPVPPREDVPSFTFGETLADFRMRWSRVGEAFFLKALLRAVHGRVGLASEVAGIDRSHLHRLLRRHGLSKSVERESLVDPDEVE
ncbi:MAG: sigma-54 dependent transcriptional regulator [Polyangiaceae bacterium]